jgi:type I restriction enzyme S subunit
MTQERRLVAHAARVPLMDHSFAVMSMDLVRVEPHEEIAAGYLHGLLRFSDFSDTIKQHANGVNVLHLNPQQIQQFCFVLPSKTFRDKYGLVSDDLYRQCDVLQRKNSNLRQTRDLLLPKLVSGEVDVTALTKP